MTTQSTITRLRIPDGQRINHTATLFGAHFPFNLEPFVYGVTSKMVRDYHGGYWEFYTLSNGGFYMAPNTAKIFAVTCENGFEGTLSADALGITACLYAYSHLSFGEGEFAETCAQQYHWLREYMFGHAEAWAILSAID